MKRGLEPVDLMVAIGTGATVLAGYFLFMSANGTLEAAPQPVPNETGPNIADAMDWVQPALGQAIVDDYVLSREASSNTTETVKKLNSATMAAHRLEASPLGYLEQIKAQATTAEADHAARVQFVMGRSVVDFTQRGIRTGALSLGQYESGYNARMIRITEAAGKKMDEQFQTNRQTRLGEAIVTASQDHDRLADKVQEGIGNAVVQLTRTEIAYQEALGGVQEQLASAAWVTTQAEQIPDHALTRPSLPYSAPRSWPEIPGGLLFAASAALIGIFCSGMLMPSGLPEAPTQEAGRLEEAERGYRKTA